MDNQTSLQWRTSQLVFGVVALFMLAGCASLPSPPWSERERTSIITPRMRIAAIQEIAARANDADADQPQLTEQLAAQIQTEPDPLVRQAIQETVAQFSTPLAREVLIAGLQDDDLDVRLACCHGLSQRDDPTVVSALRGVLENDKALDAKLAAIDALGQIKSPHSVAALGKAVNDRDPALQYAGVQALKSVSGQDLGNDVVAWRQYAASEQPEISVAQRPSSWSPFK